MPFERVLRWTLVTIAVAGLTAGLAAHAVGRPGLADLAWTLGTAPVIVGLAISIVRDFLAGRLGVDAIALLSMSAALVLGQPLAAAVVALMYSGGNVLEEIAIARAQHDLRSLVDRAPRQAHRRIGEEIEQVPIEAVSVGNQLLVRAGEIVPVDGVVSSIAATIDESAITGEPIPVAKVRGAAVLSGSLNAGETFELTATSPAGESTYAGIVRMVTAAHWSGTDPRKCFEVCVTTKTRTIFGIPYISIKKKRRGTHWRPGWQRDEGVSIPMPSDFDHRKCPNCAGRTMRLTRVEPHSPDREDGYERHVYHCAECSNVSRFVFEVPPRQQTAAFG